MAFVHGARESWPEHAWAEYWSLIDYMKDFRILPAGRHLWATGAAGRQFVMNCHVAGWGENYSEHHAWTFTQLMQGGGVGANYSSKHLRKYGLPLRELRVHVVCDPSHPDFEDIRAAGLLSETYSHEWSGSFPVEDSREGWADALTDLIDTFFKPSVGHADRVFDVSRVRGKGSPLRTFGGTASGPQPLAELLVNVGRVLTKAYLRNTVLKGAGHVSPLEAMEIDHEIGKCVVSGGVRRSARMSIVAWDDPYILEFLDCKQDASLHWTTNISVAIDSRFTDALDDSTNVLHRLASDVYKRVVTGMLTNGEPGFWNEELSQEGEPNPVLATNPCGEITLNPWECCNIGSVNMDAFAPTPDRPYTDWRGLHEAHRLMTRFLVRATFSDIYSEKQREVNAKNRRIGVGHFGVQGFLVKRGIKFSEAHTSDFPYILQDLKMTVDREAIRIAHELRIPVPVKTTTEAPTGSIAKLAGRTEGIHPVFARRFIRRVRFSTVDPAQVLQVAELAAAGHHIENDRMAANTVVVEFPTEETLVAEVRALGLNPDELIESADELSLTEMLRFQEMVQTHWADNAVSFTANLSAEPHQEEALAAGGWQLPPPTPERLTEVMNDLRPFLSTLKGSTLMIDASRPQSPYERLSDEQWAEITAPVSVDSSVDEDCATGACPIR